MGELGDILKSGKATARRLEQQDPQEPEPVEFITTYAPGPNGLPRPMFCGRPLSGPLVARGAVCMRPVQRLRNGLPTGRCGACQERQEVIERDHRAKVGQIEQAQRNLKRTDGARFRPRTDDE
jgi:hypothetical protein